MGLTGLCYCDPPLAEKQSDCKIHDTSLLGGEVHLSPKNFQLESFRIYPKFLFMNREFQVAIQAAEKASQIILQYYQSSYDVKDKGETFVSPGFNPVTSADKASNDYLKRLLLTEFPDYGWFSEETPDSLERLSQQRVWVVDPLDGTMEFIEEIPNFVVSIALVEDHLPVLGVLHNPLTGETFSAMKNKGAFLNGEPIRCSSKTELSEMVILNSRSETHDGLWKKYGRYFRGVKVVGSVAYKLGLTAAGKADIFASLRPKNEWDICAGHCIINEAGGKIVNLEGREITYNNRDTRIYGGIVAGNSVAVGKILNILKLNELLS